MNKITLTNSFHNRESSFIPQSTDNPKIGTVSKEVQRRVRRELLDGIEPYAGEGWDVTHIDNYGVLYIKFHGV
ncbi:hypothetical protein LCGC14_2203970 [marine sediment metagenome]|uniref:Uncharacterized protein n=1 Tax=marine sediment metagenome TaxID=412755 RepID=A0A0F9GBK2_9ZZZZ